MQNSFTLQCFKAYLHSWWECEQYNSVCLFISSSIILMFRFLQPKTESDSEGECVSCCGCGAMRKRIMFPLTRSLSLKWIMCFKSQAAPPIFLLLFHTWLYQGHLAQMPDSSLHPSADWTNSASFCSNISVACGQQHVLHRM